MTPRTDKTQKMTKIFKNLEKTKISINLHFFSERLLVSSYPRGGLGCTGGLMGAGEVATVGCGHQRGGEGGGNSRGGGWFNSGGVFNL